ncbi:MAG: acetyl-CoA carboxylase biotin carboxyl carrier protein subunit, partial [Streptosporangiaceae bacterium]
RDQPGRRAARAGGAGRAGAASGSQASGNVLVSPMQGTIVKIVAAEGQQVSPGDTIVVLEAMKMEQPLTAHRGGTVSGLAVQVGQTVAAGAIICEVGE